MVLAFPRFLKLRYECRSKVEMPVLFFFLCHAVKNFIMAILRQLFMLFFDLLVERIKEFYLTFLDSSLLFVSQGIGKPSWQRRRAFRKRSGRVQLQLTYPERFDSMPHYHMRWSNSTLDWEAFSTSEEAEAHAKQLVRLGESYVQADGDCQRCSSLPHLSGAKLLPGKEVSKGQEAVNIKSSSST